MSFHVPQETLDSLEWPQVVARLRAHCRTPQALGRFDAQDSFGDRQVEGPIEKTSYEDDTGGNREFPRFEENLNGALRRLQETSEARALLDADEIPPISGSVDLDDVLARASKGLGLSPRELRGVSSTLEVLHATCRFLSARSERAVQLADLASTAPEHRHLVDRIDAAIDDDDEVRDGASRELAAARRDTAQLNSELKRRLERMIRNKTIQAAMSDDYFTQRNGRYVLPVRADSRSAVRGIVHDASGSGATLFVEPEAIVEPGNKLKQAELTVVRETQRVLKELSSLVGGEARSLRYGFEVLGKLDLAFARGRLSREMDAVEPVVRQQGIFRLPQLRHPLLPADEAVANDLQLGEQELVLVISGPNGGGKTVAMKAVALSALFVRAGLHVPAAQGARVDLVDSIFVDIGDGQDIRESLSTFSAHMMNLSRIVREAGEHALVILDELGVGTDPSEGAALAQSVLETLAEAGARVITTTHYGLLKEMADVDERFCNASFEFDPQTLAPTFRIRMGTPGVSSAASVAARMGMPNAVLERANALLEREDRRLDRMLTELSASRMALDEEQRTAARLRAETESARNEYRDKLLRLQERRDKLFRSMREDLDRAFKDAHSEVAAVIRELQRGGSAREAARAREKLLSLEQRTDEAEAALEAESPSAQPGEPTAAIDWRRAAPGDPVSVPGGASGVLETLPDRRGRVRVRTGNAALVLTQDRVGPPKATPEKRAGRNQHIVLTRDEAVKEEAAETSSLRCDLRGLRVEEAIDRVAEAIDLAIVDRRPAAVFIHGFGTGALRSAVRDYLKRSPYVERYVAGDTESDTDGVTTAELRGRS